MTDTAIETTYPIAEVSERTGLPKDTLRWYEREGLLPRVDRGPDGHRRYSEREVALLQMLVRLRDTGMPTREMRDFTRMLGEGAATHGARVALLLHHRDRTAGRIQQLHADLSLLDDKVVHYRQLIADGRDCDGEPVDDATAVLQREGSA